MKKQIHKPYFIGLLFVIIAITSCKQTKDMSYSMGSQTSLIKLQQSNVASSFSFNNVYNYVRVSDFIYRHHGGSGIPVFNYVESAELKSFVLTINDTAVHKINFGIIDSFTVQIFANNLPTKIIAFNNPMGIDTSTVLTLNLINTDITSYLQANSSTLTFIVIGHTNKSMPHPISISAVDSIDFKASVTFDNAIAQKNKNQINHLLGFLLQ